MLVRKMFAILFCVVFLSEIVFSTKIQGSNVSQPSNWAIDSIEIADKLGIILQSDSIYYQENITREAFCELIVNTYEHASGNKLIVEGSNPFSDTDNEMVLKAFEKGIIKGVTATEFKPNNLITRQELAVMMLRALKALELDMGKDFIAEKDSETVKFNDEVSVASWAKDDLKCAYSNDLIKGIGANQIQPKGNTTNEQAIVMAMRLYMICYNKSYQTKHLWGYDYIDGNGDIWNVDDSNEIPELSKKIGIKNAIASASENMILKADGSVWVKTSRTPLIDGTYDYIHTEYIWSDTGLCNIKAIYDVDNGWNSTYYALRVDGVVLRWDDVNYGYVVTEGNTAVGKRSKIVTEQITIPEEIVSIDSDTYGNNIIALTTGGKVYVWNQNEDSTLIDGLDSVNKVLVEDDSYFVIKQDGTVWKFGEKIAKVDEMQLTEPIQIKGFTDIVDFDIFVNQQYTVLKNDGYVYTTGVQEYGFSYSNFNHTNEPLVKVIELEDIVEINVYSGLYLDSKGQLFLQKRISRENNYIFMTKYIADCEGSTLLRTDGIVLESTCELTRAGGFYNAPVVEVPAMKQVHLIDDNIALQKSGALWSWEVNYTDYIWNKVFTEHKVAQLTSDMVSTNFADMTAYENFIFLLHKDGSLWAVYKYEYYMNQLKKVGVQTPIKIMDDVLMITENSILKEDGTVWQLDLSKLVLGTEDNLPPVNMNLSNIKSISAEGGHTIALKNDGTVWYFGKTIISRIDYYVGYHSDKPIQINELEDAVSIQALSSGMCDGIATLDDGSIKGFYFSSSEDTGGKINMTAKLFNMGIDNLKMIKSDLVSDTVVKTDGSCYIWFGWLDFANSVTYNGAPENVFKVTKLN